ncbi:hypothetical protein BZ17_3480 [Yersinia pseudotuberculosis IP 32953]|uniref:Uncharacterized protein n=1 Tax=Yersinia pseudotuberculosis serotype I (strain IP32953) TaxID=273123 RepID=Q666W2_YERPS|nr:DUF5347 family protein [Yersinia pseudotuberculosis]AJJ57090.1 hypothetical protein BZ17_3480 [Yersinia pseudotuberculosis IP 32953]MBO1560466.1 hypothetical protein [Yersinia pseudotuberculosis]MCF1163241.1 DUF5347 domain-containing protein [Yersinia pseudotuberculosis]CAH22372.1 Conserved hypothetical protein [Yersinia pseudotuberculosis IP 32953]
MANTENTRAVTLSLKARQNGLKHAAQLWYLLRNKKHQGIIPALINEMGETDPKMKGAIYYLADIPRARHGLAFKELLPQEQVSVVDALNRWRASASLLPERVTYIDCDPLPDNNSN